MLVVYWGGGVTIGGYDRPRGTNIPAHTLHHFCSDKTTNRKNIYDTVRKGSHLSGRCMAGLLYSMCLRARNTALGGIWTAGNETRWKSPTKPPKICSCHKTVRQQRVQEKSWIEATSPPPYEHTLPRVEKRTFFPFDIMYPAWVAESAQHAKLG